MAKKHRRVVPTYGMKTEAARTFVKGVFPTSRMDEMLEALVRQVVRAHSSGDYQAVSHHAIISTIEYTQDDEPQKPVYEVFTVPSPNIQEMYQFAEFLGNLVASMAPEKIMVGTWLVGEAWSIETDKATPTKVSPSEHPDRKEIIVIAGISLDGRTNYAIVKFDRDKDNMIRVHEENAEWFGVESETKSYSRNSKHFLDTYLKAVKEKLA